MRQLCNFLHWSWAWKPYILERHCWPLLLRYRQQSWGDYSGRHPTTWPSYVKLAVLIWWEQRWWWLASFFCCRGRWGCCCSHTGASCASFLCSRGFSGCCSRVWRGRGHATVTSVAATGRTTLPEGLWRRGCFIRRGVRWSTLCWSRLGVWRGLCRCFLIWIVRTKPKLFKCWSSRDVLMSTTKGMDLGSVFYDSTNII